MRSILALLLLCFATNASAGPWKSEIFHCAANIPDGPGWQKIEAPSAPGIAPVIVMQNTRRQAVFGINVIEKYRDANLADPAIQRELETTLRNLGYQFIGHSTVKAGGFDWLQYPVTGQQQVSGIIRYASAGGYVFSITMLRGGGQEAAQDVELQQAAASFRIVPASALAGTTPGQTNKPDTEKPPATSDAAENQAAGKPNAGTEESADGDDESRKRLIWYGVAGLIVLLFFFSIIGSGRAKKK